MARRPILALTAAFVAGIMLGASRPEALTEWIMGTAAACGTCGLLWLVFRGRRGTSLAVLAVVTLSGATWYAHKTRPGSIGGFASSGTIARVRGVIVREPTEYHRCHRLTVQGTPSRGRPVSYYFIDARAIACGQEWVKVGGRVLCRATDVDLGLGLRDQVEVTGELSAIREETIPHRFDFARHCRRRGVVAQLASPTRDNVTVIRRDTRLGPAQDLNRLSERIKTLLRSALEPDEYAVSTAILLGQRHMIDPRLSRAFQETGTMHYLAISGLHVGLMALMVVAALKLMGVPHRPRALMVIVFLLAYGQLVGWRPSVARAVAMMAVLFAAPLVNRVGDGVNALCLAALLVLVKEPADLFSAGFQLSFAGVAGIVFVRPRLVSLLGLRPTRMDALQDDEHRGFAQRLFPRAIGGLICASLAAWLATFPLVAYHFHVFTPLVVLFNLVLCTVVWLCLAVGLPLVLSLGWLAPLLVPAIGLLARGIIVIVTGCRMIPGACWDVSPPPLLALVAYYALGAAWLCREQLGLRLKHLAMAGLVAANVWLFAGLTTRRDDEVRATFLDVSHGLSVLVEFPDGRTLLYDAGSRSNPRVGETALAPYLLGAGRRHVDAVVLSHPDMDHCNGLVDLIERVHVGAIFVSPAFLQCSVGRLLGEVASRQRVPLATVSQSDEIHLTPTARIEILHPPAAGPLLPLLDDNDQSLVVRIEALGRSMLLTGDASAGAWACIGQAGMIRKADVVLLPHHGGYFAGIEAFLHSQQGGLAMVSKGRKPLAPRVAAACERAGLPLLDTSRLGTVRVLLRNGSTSVEAWRAGRWRTVLGASDRLKAGIQTGLTQRQGVGSNLPKRSRRTGEARVLSPSSPVRGGGPLAYGEALAEP